MAATKDNPIVFYDIFATEGAWSPSTFKIRLTLNYKRLPYRVEFLSIADIEAKLEGLGVPAASPRSPKHRLPMIADPSSDPNGEPTYVVDSFDIAAYLDDQYPAPKYPTVLPDGTRTLQKITSDLFTYELGFAIMPIVVPLVARPGFLDDRGHEYFCRTREAWFGSLSDYAKSGAEKWEEIHEKWDSFGKKLDLNNGPSESGPFVMGDHISFSDFAIGSLIHWLRRAEGGDMPRWKELSEWQEGRWGRIWAEIEKVVEDSTEVA